MRILQHIASMLLLIGLLCPAAQAADQTDPLADLIARGAAAKWSDVLARIDSEERRRSRPVVKVSMRARPQRAGCCSSLSLVANARAALD
jgi:hypothetical protein